MKKIIGGLLLIASLVSTAHAQEARLNGTFWKVMNGEEKLIYIRAVYSMKVDDASVVMRLYKEADSDDEKRLQELQNVAKIGFKNEHDTSVFKAYIKLQRDLVEFQRTNLRITWLRIVKDDIDSVSGQSGSAATWGEIKSGVNTFFRVPANLPVCTVHA